MNIAIIDLDGDEQAVLNVFRYLGPKLPFSKIDGMFRRSGGQLAVLEQSLSALVGKALLSGPHGSSQEYHLTESGVAAVGRWQIRR